MEPYVFFNNVSHRSCHVNVKHVFNGHVNSLKLYITQRQAALSWICKTQKFMHVNKCWHNSHKHTHHGCCYAIHPSRNSFSELSVTCHLSHGTPHLLFVTTREFKYDGRWVMVYHNHTCILLDAGVCWCQCIKTSAIVCEACGAQSIDGSHGIEWGTCQPTQSHASHRTQWTAPWSLAC
jgi:hypothetical protein